MTKQWVIGASEQHCFGSRGGNFWQAFRHRITSQYLETYRPEDRAKQLVSAKGALRTFLQDETGQYVSYLWLLTDGGQCSARNDKIAGQILQDKIDGHMTVLREHGTTKFPSDLKTTLKRRTDVDLLTRRRALGQMGVIEFEQVEFSNRTTAIDIWFTQNAKDVAATLGNYQ